jgi:hypothetical protein
MQAADSGREGAAVLFKFWLINSENLGMEQCCCYVPILLHYYFHSLGEMLEEETAIVEGYNAYFSFSKVRSGYSGSTMDCFLLAKLHFFLM